jgi:hypothetical protein
MSFAPILEDKYSRNYSKSSKLIVRTKFQTKPSPNVLNKTDGVVAKARKIMPPPPKVGPWLRHCIGPLGKHFYYLHKFKDAVKFALCISSAHYRVGPADTV